MKRPWSQKRTCNPKEKGNLFKFFAPENQETAECIKKHVHVQVMAVAFFVFSRLTRFKPGKEKDEDQEDEDRARASPS